MAIEPIKGFYVHDEVTNTDGVAKVSIDAVHEFVEDVSGTVENWLDEHPEATTTVQDGAVTTGKLANGAVTESKTDVDFLKAIKNAYVTPEMFGAKGDGTTDDTASIQAAIDSGLPVVGDKTKTYRAEGLTLKSYARIESMLFKPVTSGSTCITVSSHSYLGYCSFSEFETAIKSRADGSTVHAVIYKCLIQYCKHGIVLDQNTYSCNNIIVLCNYFVKMGTSPDDMTTQPETDAGEGIKALGNWDGLQIIGNVFEYCTNCGVYLYNKNNNFRVGATVIGNYFEGNKYSAITVDITTLINMVKISGNFYSWTNTNVFNTKYLWWQSGCTCFDIENVSKITMSACGLGSTDYLDRNTGTATITAGSSQYMSMVTALYREGTGKTAKLVYHATLNSSIQLRASNAQTVLATLTNGRGVVYISMENSFFWNRVLAEGEQIVIESYEQA